MTPQEMVIEVRQQISELGTTRLRRLLDEQIEMKLNNAVETYIDNCLEMRENGTYEIKKEENIRTLVVLDEPLWLTTNPIRAILPGDLWKFCSDSSLIHCGTTLPVSVATKTLYKYKLPVSNKGTGPYYGFTITGIPGVAQIDHIAAHQTKDAISAIRVGLRIQELLRANGIKVFTQDAPFAGTSFFVTDQEVSISVDEQSIADSTVVISTLTLDQSSSKLAANNLVPPEIAHDRLVTPFYKPNNQAPISALYGGGLRVFVGENGILTGVHLNYIRRPQRISVILNSNCDLPISTHQDICRLAVERIQLDIGDPKLNSTIDVNRIPTKP